MFNQGLNVVDAAPDFFIGFDKGYPVLSPALRTVRIDANTTLDKKLHGGAILLVSGNYTLTLGPQTQLFSTIVVPAVGTTTTVAAAGTATANYAATPITRSQASNTAGFSILPISLSDFLVGGA